MGRLANFFSEQNIVLDGQKKQKMLSLDRQFVETETERDSLKTENLHLKAQVKPLEREVQRLQDQVKKIGSQDHGRLDELAEKILLALANGEYDRERIFAPLNISKVKGDHLFDVLADRKLVNYEFGMTTPTPLGRAYLVKHDLIN